MKHRERDIIYRTVHNVDSWTLRQH